MHWGPPALDELGKHVSKDLGQLEFSSARARKISAQGADVREKIW